MSAVLDLSPAIEAAQVEEALSDWLEKTHGAALEPGEQGPLMIEYRVAASAPLVCQLVTSDLSTQTRRSVAVFSDAVGAVALIDEAPLTGVTAAHLVVDLSEPVRLLLELLVPLTLPVSGVRRGVLNDLSSVDPDALLNALEQQLAPGLIIAVTSNSDAAPSVPQRDLLGQLAGLALVGIAPSDAPLLARTGLPSPARAGSAFSISRAGDGLDKQMVPATSLRMRTESARRLLLRRHLSAPVPIDLERRRALAMARLLVTGESIDLPAALELLEEESHRASALDNRVRELETLLQRSYEEQDAALRDLDDAQSQVRYLQKAFRDLGEVPIGATQDDEEWNPECAVDALVAAREVLPFLVISAREEDAAVLDTQQKRAIWAKKIWSSMRALNDYCQAKTEGRFAGDIAMYRHNTPQGAIPLLADYAPSESKSTRSDPSLVAARTFRLSTAVKASGSAYMDQHIKIDRGGQSAPRIHLLDDSDGPTQRIHVGYVGPHLPTASGF